MNDATFLIQLLMGYGRQLRPFGFNQKTLEEHTDERIEDDTEQLLG